MFGEPVCQSVMCAQCPEVASAQMGERLDPGIGQPQGVTTVGRLVDRQQPRRHQIDFDSVPARPASGTPNLREPLSVGPGQVRLGHERGLADRIPNINTVSISKAVEALAQRRLGAVGAGANVLSFGRFQNAEGSASALA
jgi:hypothetical protein